jgi:hypothetical protein
MSPAEQFELEELRDEAATAQAVARYEAEQQYTEMVQAVAAGFEIDTEAGEQIIAACGKTTADFQRDLAPLSLIYSQRRLREATWHATANRATLAAQCL